MAGCIWMLFGVVSGVVRGMVLDGVEIAEGEGAVFRVRDFEA